MSWLELLVDKKIQKNTHIVVSEHIEQMNYDRRFPDVLDFSTLRTREGSIYGPLCNDLAIEVPYFLRFKIAVLFLRRVRVPLHPLPHGVTGCDPDFERPSPPPCG